jgi:ATP-dependent helicase HrpA
MLAGLLGNIGARPMTTTGTSARAASSSGAIRAPPVEEARPLADGAELVETTRLFGRGLAAIEPTWIERIGGHLLKTQLLEPHWEKKAAEVVALERATLYGLVIYNNRKVNFGRIDTPAAREIFIREALVHGEWETKLAFLAHNEKLIRQVQELEHKARRQDVLIDDELIFAFYAQQCRPTWSAALADAGTATKVSIARVVEARATADAPRAAGITTTAFPKTIRLGGIGAPRATCTNGDARTASPSRCRSALNQVSEERCELVPGMLPVRCWPGEELASAPRSRLVPLPDYADEFCAGTPFAQGNLIDALLMAVRDRTELAVQRNDFKLETLPAHLWMNFRVTDEHGRQLGSGRNLAALKAELGTQARSAFQALAALKLPSAAASATAPSPQPSPKGRGS